MRSIGRKRREEGDEESVFVPMTDMTVSFLFIVMILLAFFAVQFSDEDNVPRSVYEVILDERNVLKDKVEQLEAEIVRLNDIIDRLQDKNNDLREQNKVLTDENSRLDRDLIAARIFIDDLQKEIEDLTEKNRLLNEAVYSLSKELGNLKVLIRKRDELIATLQDKILEFERRLEFLEQLKSKLDIKIIELEGRISELYSDIDNLLLLLNAKDELLAARNNSIKNLKQIIDALLLKVEQRDIKIIELENQLEELITRLNADPLEEYLIQSQMKRSAILSEIERKLKIEFPDILVEVSPENDALRFKGDGLFQSGSSQLSSSKRRIVEKVGVLIVDAIECYTINKKEPDYQSCNPDGILIEAVQIEGHTDNSRFIGSDGRDRNIELSAKRAESAFFAMKDAQSDLLSFENLKGQPVISIAGYGSMRPVNKNPLLKAENRRIDLRLIMFTPTSRDQVSKIQKRIDDDLEILLEESE